MNIKTQMLKQIADEHAGAQWISCRPVERCVRCGSERRHHGDGGDGGPVDCCAACGGFDTEEFTPVVLGASPDNSAAIAYPV